MKHGLLYCGSDTQKETGFEMINPDRGGLNGWHLVRLSVASETPGRIRGCD